MKNFVEGGGGSFADNSLFGYVSVALSARGRLSFNSFLIKYLISPASMPTPRVLCSSLPFVNYAWRSSIFDLSEVVEEESVKDRLLRLQQQLDPEPNYLGVLGDLAKRLDEYVLTLDDTSVRKDLGLVPLADISGDGYGMGTKRAGRFVQVLATAAVLDRALATHKPDGQPWVIRQALHPVNVNSTTLMQEVAYKRQDDNLKRLASAFQTISLAREPKAWAKIRTYRAEAATKAVALTVAGASAASSYSHLYEVVSNVFVIASAILVLSKVRGWWCFFFLDCQLFAFRELITKIM
jgi:hypothetical protein